MTGTAPAPLRVGTGLWCAAAAFLLVQALLSWTGIGQLERHLVGTGVGDAAGTAQSLLLTNLLLAVALAVVYTVLGLWLGRRRSPRVRGVLTVVAFGHAIMVFGTIAATLPNLIVLVLLAAALACSWKRDSSEWLHGEHD